MRTRYASLALALLFALGLASAATAQVTFYTSRAAWQAAIPGPYVTEDYEDTNVAAAAIVGCQGPATSASNEPACWDAGDLVVGISHNSNPPRPVPDPDGALALLGAGWSINPTRVLCNNYFADDYELTFTTVVRSFGADVGTLFGPSPLSINVYDTANNLIGTTNLGTVDLSMSTFMGFRSVAPVGRVLLVTDASNDACADNVEYSANFVPVELTAFTGTANGQAVDLRWETASETNNAGFEVQQLRGAEWTALAFVEGHGTTTEAQRYAFTTGALAPGAHTFRLRQVDFDGAFEVTEEVEVTIGVPGTHALSAAYPNPFNPQTSFTLAVATTQPVTVEAFNVLGQRVATLFSGSLEGGTSHAFTFDGASLPSGLYVVRATGQTFSESIQATLLK